MTENWNNIITTAMLGTAKKQVQPDDLPPAMADLFPKIEKDNPEETLLNAASLILGCRQAGTMPFSMELPELKPCPHEEKQYCSTKAQKVLKSLLQENSAPLLMYWLNRCQEKELIIQPDVLPALLDKAKEQTQWQSLILSCGGFRAQWLASFNSEWNFLKPTDSKELWETGTMEERKALLKKVRQQNPEEGLIMLQSVWKSETAKTKQDFLKIIGETLALSDTQWLEGLLTERSKKVVAQAREFLMRLPDSSIIGTFTQFIQKSLKVEQGKTLGFIKKETLVIEIPETLDEDLIAAGIEKISTIKDLSDQEFWLFQVICCLPPNVLENHLQLPPEKIIALFQKKKNGPEYLMALIQSILNFQSSTWAEAFLQGNTHRSLKLKKEHIALDLIELLPQEQWDGFLISLFETSPDKIINIATKQKGQWSIALTKKIMIRAADDLYRYHKGFFKDHILKLPKETHEIMEQIVPRHGYCHGQWENTTNEIQRILQLKFEIQQSI